MKLRLITKDDNILAGDTVYYRSYICTTETTIQNANKLVVKRVRKNFLTVETSGEMKFRRNGSKFSDKHHRPCLYIEQAD